jgi:glycerol-3-phosphate responsive antiterminator
MKKILILMLIGFLAACESSPMIQEQEVVLEPVVVEVTPVEVLPEVVEEVIEEFNWKTPTPIMKSMSNK